MKWNEDFGNNRKKEKEKEQKRSKNGDNQEVTWGSTMQGT